MPTTEKSKGMKALELLRSSQNNFDADLFETGCAGMNEADIHELSVRLRILSLGQRILQLNEQIENIKKDPKK